MRVLTDPDVYRLELERVFAKTWNFIGHVSEIPNANDYVMRYIGEDPVIVTRHASGEINVLLNVCSHRGMVICRADQGKAAHFRCPYHGWTFSNNGTFLGAPIAKEKMHGDIRTREELGLRKARVATYAGLIFATWEDEAPSLEEFLGDMRWYMDLMFDRTTEGLTVLGPPQRFMINTNWKCPGEQHGGDGFHALTLHESLAELQTMSGGDDTPTAQLGVNISANGHGLRCIDQREPYIPFYKNKVTKVMDPMARLRAMPPPGLTAKQVEQLPRRFDAGQLKTLAEVPPQAGGLFPNVGMFSFHFPTATGVSAVICLHSFVPKGPEKIEFFNWFLAEKAATAEERAEISRCSNLSFGISGFIETDDAETWPHMTEAARGVIGRQQKLRYQALVGENRPADWSGGGKVFAGFAKDDSQWEWWQHYFDVMCGKIKL